MRTEGNRSDARDRPHDLDCPARSRLRDRVRVGRLPVVERRVFMDKSREERHENRCDQDESEQRPFAHRRGTDALSVPFLAPFVPARSAHEESIDLAPN